MSDQGTCDVKSSKKTKWGEKWDDDWDDWESTHWDEIAAESIRKQKIEKVYLPQCLFD